MECLLSDERREGLLRVFSNRNCARPAVSRCRVTRVPCAFTLFVKLIPFLSIRISETGLSLLGASANCRAAFQLLRQRV